MIIVAIKGANQSTPRNGRHQMARMPLKNKNYHYSTEAKWKQKSKLVTGQNWEVSKKGVL